MYGQKPGNESMATLGNHLRTRRRQWLLSQKELAFLLGYKDTSIISRLERHERTLTFSTLRACKIIFGSGIEELFPALSKEADGKLRERMHELREELEQSGRSKRTEVKLRLLQEAMSRLAAGKSSKEQCE
jgi:transcriptional regulator with XRE-family HTH domain